MIRLSVIGEFFELACVNIHACYNARVLQCTLAVMVKGVLQNIYKRVNILNQKYEEIIDQLLYPGS